MSPHRTSSTLGLPERSRPYIAAQTQPHPEDWAGRLARAENEILHLWISGDRKADAMDEQQALLEEISEYIERQKRLLEFLKHHGVAIGKFLLACVMLALTMLNILDVSTSATLYKKSQQFLEKIHSQESASPS